MSRSQNIGIKDPMVIMCLSCVSGVHSSKYRHLEGIPGPRGQHIENIRNLSHTLPGESDMFHANRGRFALPLSGAGGLVAVLEVSIEWLRGTGKL